jgi:hypothetical protein
MNAKNITLRPGRPADAAKIAAMSRDLIETGLGWSWGPDRVARSIANKDTSTLLACERDRVVAFAIMYFGDEHAHLNLSRPTPRASPRFISSCAPRTTPRAASTDRSASPNPPTSRAITAGAKWRCAWCGC